MRTSVSIVGGCGRVGLPLGLALSRAGATVTLIDRDSDRVGAVLEGRMPFAEQNADLALADALRTSRLMATTDLSAAGRTKAVVVTIGTPLDEYLAPSTAPFEAALGQLLTHLWSGQLLILRSTVPAGLTDRFAQRAAVDLPGLDDRLLP